MQEVHGVMVEAAVNVAQQGETIDLITVNIGATSENVNEAHKEIGIANTESKKANKKL